MNNQPGELAIKAEENPAAIVSRGVQRHVLFIATLITFMVFGASVGEFYAQNQSESAPQKARLQVFLVGDSTMADKPLKGNPERGWGQIFPRYFDNRIEIKNHAVNGRSTKSFRDEGRWDEVLKNVRPGDWIFIQFGHNDSKISDPARYASPQDYRKNLIGYINDARSKGARILLITPVMRRKFDSSGGFQDTHAGYPDVVRNLAKEMGLPMFDLHQKSRALIEAHGVERSKNMFLWVPPQHFTAIPDGKQDDTHFSEYGASLIASLVADGLHELKLDIAGYLKQSEFNDKYTYQLPKIYEPHFSNLDFRISDFGAINDGLTINTKAINDSIEAASKAGGGRVIIPAGIWLTGPIVLKSNVNLNLENGALLTFSKDRSNYPLVMTSFEGVAAYRSQAPISAFRAENIGITGEGILDGGGDAWKPVKKGKITDSEWKKLVGSGGAVSADGSTWYPSEGALKGSLSGDVGRATAGKTEKDFKPIKDFLRPNMVQIFESKNIIIDGVTFQNSPAWTLHFLLSEQITLRGVKVKNPWYGQNNDAVDLESSRNALLDGCVFDTGDDAITLKSGRDEQGRKRGVPTENVIVRNCTIYHAHGGFVIGSEMSGGVRNAYISNSTFIGTDIGLRFKTKRDRGGIVENVYAARIDMKDIPGEAISFDMYYEAKDPIPLAGDTSITPRMETLPVNEGTPQFRNFFLNDIIVQGAKKGIFVRGLPEMNIRDVVMKNLVIQADEGMYCEECDGILFRNLTLYASKTNPVISLLNSKRITLDSLNYGKGAALLVTISGESSTGIRLLNTDMSSAKKEYRFIDGASDRALSRK